MLAPVPGFVMYALSAQLQGLDFVGVPLTPDFELDEAAMLAAIAAAPPGHHLHRLPEQPHGHAVGRGGGAAHHRRRGRAGRHRAMDEAYQPFASRTWLDRMRAEPARNAHVLLMRTLSKFGLAGVRLGYLMGPAALVAEIDKVRPPYNVSVLNCEAALFALEHAEVFAAQAARTARPAHSAWWQPCAPCPAWKKVLGQRGQHGAGARGRCRPHLCRHARAQGPGQERFYNAPIAGPTACA
jgi:histidinol-phosphate aminotransferase